MPLTQALLTVDTCACQVLEAWDDSVPALQRVHALVAVVARCAVHSQVRDKSLLGLIREEAHRKAVAVALATAQIPGLALQPDALAWAYTPGRTLELWFTGLRVSQRHRRLLQAQCDDQLGRQKVLVRR